jgi:hypothetical protein
MRTGGPAQLAPALDLLVDVRAKGAVEELVEAVRIPEAVHVGLASPQRTACQQLAKKSPGKAGATFHEVN